MNKNIKPKDLEGFINNEIKEAITACGKIAEKKLRDFLWENWYVANDNFNEEYYERTHQLLNSITLKPILNSKRFSVELFFDTTKIIPMENKNKPFNAHMSIDGKQYTKSPKKYIPKQLPIWIEYGVDGGLYPHSGAFMVQDTYDFIINNYKIILKKEFESKGIKVKF